MKSNCSVNTAMRSLLLLLFSFFLINNNVTAQAARAPGKKVNGTVRDSKNEPLPAVSVTVKGNTSGVATDATGKYTINVSDTGTLVFSYIGITPQEIAVNGQSTIDVTMSTDNNVTTLNDVVVVGYGSQKKVNVIGSVVTVNSKDITASPVSNVSNALAGRLPGAIIQQSNGEPGKDAASISIRGLATLGNNSPLVVVDGIQDRDINSLNPNDIESISVLKDASAAIYGARAANGVILVTTKRGRDGAPLSVNYSFYQGFLQPTALPKMADAATYASMIREVQTYANTDEANMKFSLDDIERYRSGKYPWTNPNTDWFDAALAKYSHRSNHNASLSGSGKSTNYFVSFGSQSDDGIFKNSATSFKRYNLTANFTAKVFDYLTLGVNVIGSQENRDYPSTSASFNFEGAVKSLPTSPAFYPNGLPGPDIAYGQNPVVSSTSQTGFDQENRYRANTLFTASLKVPGVNGLTLSTYYAYDVNLGQRKLFQTPWTLYQLDEPAYLAAGNTGVEDGSAFLVGTLKGTSEPNLNNFYDDSRTKTFNFKTDYTKQFGNHNISAFAAVETSEYNGKGIGASRRYFVSDQLPYLFAGGDADKNNSEYVSIDSRVNYFGRISYNYKETYLLQVSFRRDGSLRFSKESGRWGNFPSVLAGWNVSNENWWKNGVSFVNFLKLKASWGQLGNDLVNPFQYLSSYAISTGYVLGSGRTYATGLSQSGAVNPNITWEIANVYNAGFESYLFKNKITFNADFFYQRRNNILVQRNASVPNYTGIQLPDENYGIVDNKGFEVVLGYNDKAGDFTYSINGNFAFARNKVIEFDEPASQVAWQRVTGHPQGTQLLYKSSGIFKDQSEIDKTPHVPGAIPGDIIIEDYDKDGEITANDRILFPKTVNPEITYGINFNLSYKNFSLSCLVQGAGNAMRRVYLELQGFAGNYFAYDADGRWTPDNINATKPRAFDRTDAYWRNNYLTDYSFQNAAYARMKNLQLAYTLPQHILRPLHLTNAQVYVAGQNLFLIYNGNKIIDPEVGGIRTVTGTASYGVADPANAGPLNYPIMKVYNVGVRITL